MRNAEWSFVNKFKKWRGIMVIWWIDGTKYDWETTLAGDFDYSINLPSIMWSIMETISKSILKLFEKSQPLPQNCFEWI